MTEYAVFSISAGEQERLRLKGFTARTKGARATITITVETDDTFALAYALRELAAVEKLQAEAARQRSRRKPLALPPPEVTP